MRLRLGSLFSGIGGFDLGAERAGWTCAWQVENDKRCREVLTHHWPGMERHGDIQNIQGLPPVDCIAGGFPCQDLSVAGQRRGLDGSRSVLWWEFWRLLVGSATPWVVVENVPGLLWSNKGRDMGLLLGSLAELGYGWAYRVLDAQYFGVAQRRRRVFIVGHLGDWRRAAEVLFDAASLQRHPPSRREAGAGVAGPLEARAATGGYDPGARGAATGHIVSAVTAKWAKGTGGPSGDETQNIVTHALTSEGHDTSEDGTGRGVAIAFDTTQITSAENYSNPQAGDPCHPLAAGAHPPAVTLGPRRLTPLECERLQGFPDHWTAIDGMADSPRYRMLGNAVAVPVATWILARIAKRASA